MRFDWSALTQEMSHWRSENLILPLWWRDDDAVAETPALVRLSELSTETGLPVHLAIIPDLIEDSLIAEVKQQAQLIPVIHGWRHESHAPIGSKNAEFGHMRADVPAELGQAFDRMKDSFGDRLVSIFVPPWNRIAPEVLPILEASGYRGLSTYGPRQAVQPIQNITQINTHIDPIFWRGHRGLSDPEELVIGITTTLRDRRMGLTDKEEPLGLLTHHLVHTEAVWAFTGDLVRVLLDAGAIPADIAGLLQAGRRPSI
ncbi:polysaccharide deacetylase family protein [uncultured Sulfitobacter sp.]|uniref:polysaccharide deacetylase family protein n=1 Tax=uncultured Sulfitobacter sp. TaxID=191468 RepID=UPI00261F4CFC|nr:polysaccharide deacetylase family protein [uncultured Sulfitobacter sp.]